MYCSLLLTYSSLEHLLRGDLSGNTNMVQYQLGVRGAFFSYIGTFQMMR